MAEKDIAEKDLFRWNDVFANAWNVLVRKGGPLMKEEDLLEEDTASSHSDRKGELHERRSDVRKLWVQNGIVVLSAGIENQTAEDPEMILRVMRYDLNHMESRSSESLHGAKTVVFYYGCERWKGPKTLHELLRKVHPDHDPAEAGIVDYEITVIEMAFLEQEVRDQLIPDLRLLTSLLHALYVDENVYVDLADAGRLRHPQDTVQLMSLLFDGDSVVKDVYEIYNKSRKGEQIMTTWKELLERRLDERFEERQMERDLEAAYKFASNLEDTSEMSFEHIIKGFGVSESDRQILLEMKRNGVPY